METRFFLTTNVVNPENGEIIYTAGSLLSQDNLTELYATYGVVYVACQTVTKPQNHFDDDVVEYIIDRCKNLLVV
jgi:hypothetical protein